MSPIIEKSKRIMGHAHENIEMQTHIIDSRPITEGNRTFISNGQPYNIQQNYIDNRYVVQCELTNQQYQIQNPTQYPILYPIRNPIQFPIQNQTQNNILNQYQLQEIQITNYQDQNEFLEGQEFPEIQNVFQPKRFPEQQCRQYNQYPRQEFVGENQFQASGVYMNNQEQEYYHQQQKQLLLYTSLQLQKEIQLKEKEKERENQFLQQYQKQQKEIEFQQKLKDNQLQQRQHIIQQNTKIQLNKQIKQNMEIKQNKQIQPNKQYQQNDKQTQQNKQYQQNIQLQQNIQTSLAKQANRQQQQLVKTRGNNKLTNKDEDYIKHVIQYRNIVKQHKLIQNEFTRLEQQKKTTVSQQHQHSNQHSKHQKMQDLNNQLENKIDEYKSTLAQMANGITMRETKTKQKQNQTLQLTQKEQKNAHIKNQIELEENDNIKQTLNPQDTQVKNQHSTSNKQKEQIVGVPKQILRHKNESPPTSKVNKLLVEKKVYWDVENEKVFVLKCKSKECHQMDIKVIDLIDDWTFTKEEDINIMENESNPPFDEHNTQLYESNIICKSSSGNITSKEGYIPFITENITPTATKNNTPTATLNIIPLNTLNITPHGVVDITPTATKNITPPGTVNNTPPGTLNITPPDVVDMTPSGVVDITEPGVVDITEPDSVNNKPPALINNTPPATKNNTPITKENIKICKTDSNEDSPMDKQNQSKRLTKEKDTHILASNTKQLISMATKPSTIDYPRATKSISMATKPSNTLKRSPVEHEIKCRHIIGKKRRLNEKHRRLKKLDIINQSKPNQDLIYIKNAGFIKTKSFDCSIYSTKASTGQNVNQTKIKHLYSSESNFSFPPDHPVEKNPSTQPHNPAERNTHEQNILKPEPTQNEQDFRNSFFAVFESFYSCRR